MSAGDVPFIEPAGNDTEQGRNEQALVRSNRALKLLSRCNEAAFRAEREQPLLEQICRIAVEQGGYRMAWVGYAMQDADSSIAAMAHAGDERGYLAEIRLSWSEQQPSGLGPAGCTIRGGKPTVCVDVTGAATNFLWIEAARARGYQTVICLPLTLEGNTFGLLGLYSSVIESVSDDELTLLQQLADTLAFGIGTLRARDELRRDLATRKRQQRQMRLLSEATLMANTRIEDPALMEHLCEALREVLGCHQAVITLNRNQAGAQAIHAISLSDKYARWRTFTEPVTGAKGLGTFVRESGKSLRLTQSELEVHPHWHGFGKHAAAHPPLRGWMGIPLFGSDGSSAGLLQVSDACEDEFSEEDEAIAVQFAHMIAVTVERSRLIERLQERDRKLEESLEVLSTRNRELQDFAFIASHDLQEPLRKVRAFAERLVGNYAARLEGPGLEYLERMTSAVERMQRLIDALLDYSRVLSRARTLVVVELDAVLRGVIEDLEERLNETGGQVVSAPLPQVLGDRTQLGQLFQNLIANALKFRGPERAPRVEIRVSPSELAGAPAWTIEVADNGIGFADEFRERIFAPFQRLHGRTEYEGTGMGLAIVRRIVERHGGSVCAHGTPGVGATFSVQLPQLKEGNAVRED